MRDDRQVYAKTIRASLGQWAEGTAEVAAAAALPCAPALGVHRPYCQCGISKPAQVEKKRRKK